MDTKQLNDLEESVTGMAQKFARHPEDGYAAGYRPRQRFVRSREIGSNQIAVASSSLEEWLRAIMERDYSDYDYDIEPTFGRAILLIHHDPRRQ